MKRAKLGVILFLIVAAIGATTFLCSPVYASDGVESVSVTEQAPGGGDWGDPDQPDPTRSSSYTRGVMPRIGTGAPRGYTVDSGSVATAPIARGWMDVVMWMLRARIGW